MKRAITFIIFNIILCLSSFGQMWNGVDTLYGNEWIDYDQTYYKVLVAKDSIYRISYQTLENNGFPMNSIQANQIRLYYQGSEQAIFVNEGEEFIEFFGKRNRSKIDGYLYKNPEEELANPEYSLFTDSSAYFLTWSSTSSDVRMEVITNDLSNVNTPEPFCLYSETTVYSDIPSKKRYSGNLYHTNFDVAEGFVGQDKLSQNIDISTPSVYSSGPESKLEATVVVTNFTQQNTSHEQRMSFNGNQLAIDAFTNAKVIHHSYDISTSSLQATNQVSFEGLFNNNDKQKLAFVKLTYPKVFDFENKSLIQFSLPASNLSQYLEINNFNVSNGNPILYDITNRLRIEADVTGDQVRIVLPAAVNQRDLILFNPGNGVEEITIGKQINFIDYRQSDAEFIIISHQSLYDDGQGNNWVQEYANYRQNSPIAPYETTIVDIQQLYDQFAYGINRHSISIRNFGHFINKNWTNPKYVFLIGKGINYDLMRSPQEVESLISQNLFLIPTFGTKGGGDNLLLSTNYTDHPIFSMGRLAARTPQHVKIYLDKVIAQETNQAQPQTIENQYWKKRILHLGGGNSQEQPRFKNYLTGFEEEIENNQFGADVISFYKTTSDPVQISVSDQLTTIVNEGVSVMTLFGHASLGGFDFSIDNAASYDNEGRFPVLMSLGCFSGFIHSNFIGISEDFVLTDKKGAIAFIASTGLSLENGLRRFGNEFYEQLGETSYGEGIGDIMRKSLENTNNSIGFLTGMLTLHGDPAIRVSVGEGPDYIIDPNSVKFDPNPISIQKETFELSFDIINLGQRNNEKMQIEIIQELPNGIRHNIVVDSIETPAFRENQIYNIPNLGSQALGANKFYIELDKGNKIVELPNPEAELNNQLGNASGSEGVTVYFISNEVLPVFPKEYSIVNNPNLTLKASTSSPFIETQTYVFEIDTTETFDSPFLQRHEMAQSGGVLKWKPNIPFQNNVVYYWRVSPEEDLGVGGFIWRSSSFLYDVNSSNGWNQSHFHQFQDDTYRDIELLDDRTFEYIKDFKDVKVENYAVEFPFGLQSRIFVNNVRRGRYYGAPDAAIGIAVLDSFTIEPWINANGSQYGEGLISGSVREIWPFSVNTQAKRENLINFLENEVPDGNYVIFMTLHEKGFSYIPEEWAADSVALGTNLFKVLEDQGATVVRNLEDTGSIPYVFAYRKGHGGIEESIASDEDDDAGFTFGIPGNWNEGYIESTKIGPARSWESLQWQSSSIDNLPTDELYLDVIGVDVMGEDSLLYQQVVSTDTSLTQINAEEFPYLKLRFNTKDTINNTTAQLDYWRVLFEGIPEVALNPAAYFSFQKDTLTQGENLKMKVAIENIGEYDTDSLLVNFSITDITNNRTDIFKRFKPLLEGDTLIANLEYETFNLANKNTIQVFANPNNDQREEYLFNNTGLFDFYVETDKRNPLLDVTFDGVHIMDGDLVSSRPGIVISLKDENEFLALDDPELVNVFLKSPNDPEVKRIFVDGDTLTFSPGNVNGGGNKSQFLFQPKLSVDGTYYLIVQAQDKTGNQSGALDYKISFDIKNQSSITNVLNYPNPFSTSTRFVFTITGSEIPEDMKIQILTISGRIVREIRQEELGPLHVGNNITEYAWDGTDEYGQKLANGVYLYRVVSRKANNEEFEHLNNRSDQFFKNGFGKMVIIR